MHSVVMILSIKISGLYPWLHNLGNELLRDLFLSVIMEAPLGAPVRGLVMVIVYYPQRDDTMAGNDCYTDRRVGLNGPGDVTVEYKLIC